MIEKLEKPIEEQKIVIARRWSKLEWEASEKGVEIDELLDHYENLGLKERKWNSHLEQINSINFLSNKLPKAEIRVGMTLEKSMFKDTNLVIALGGDGHLKYVSHFLDGQMVAAVNADPLRSTGFMYYFDSVENFWQFFPNLIKGNYQIEHWTRLKACLNKNPIYPLALNDITFTADHPLDMTRYVIKYRGIEEEQKTSGVLVATGSGSTGWYKKISLTQKRRSGVFDREKNLAKFIVREEPVKRHSDYQIVSGKLTLGEKLKIVSYIDNLIVCPDSYKTDVYYAPSGTEVSVEIADTPLRVIKP